MTVEPENSPIIGEGLTRQCGRCRQTFAKDMDLDLRSQEGWWLCPPCYDTFYAGR